MRISARTTAAAFLLALFSSEDRAGEIVRGADHFQINYIVKLPEISAAARLWIPLARTDSFQDVQILRIKAPISYRISTDHEGSNDVLFASLTRADSGHAVEIDYQVTRLEKNPYPVDANPTRYLQPERLVPASDLFPREAKALIAAGARDEPAPELLYRHVLHHMKYDNSVPGSCLGDALFASQACAGNCSDFHSYFIALARAAGIPARFAIGFTIPSASREGAIRSYHCWAEYAWNGKWIPVDISEASKHPELADYYSRHQPANRFELSRGRDLVFDPLPVSGPVNFFVYPLLEVDGKTAPVETKVSYSRGNG